MKKTKKSFLINVFIATLFLGLFSFILKDQQLYVFPNLVHFPKMPQPESNQVTKEGQELGRYLFYDPILSSDSTFSCASCHIQKFAFSDTTAFSKGIHKQRQERNTLPLFNLAWYKRLFYDGRASSIELQVFHPVRNKNEMDLNWVGATKRINRSKFYKKKFQKVFGNVAIDSTMVAKVIAQFERTLLSYNSKYDKAIRKQASFTMDELEGLELVNDMTKTSCLHCHTTDADALGTTGDFSNNGLDEIKSITDFKDKGLGRISGKPSDYGKFKIPSFRNLLFTAPYMHDGRFKTLEEVLDFYSEGIKISPTIDSKMEFAHKGGSRLTKDEKRKIIAFLKTMSDSIFITSKEFSNPFIK